MKTIYILLTKSSTIVSRIVGMATLDKYTHVSISFDDCLQPMYSSARKNGKTMFPAGPCSENFHHGYLGSHTAIPCALYTLSVPDEIYFAARDAARRIIDNADYYRYNIIGLFLCRMHIAYHRRRHFFCSQFVGDVLEGSNALKLPKDSTLMRPSDYTRIPELTCVFTGRLMELLESEFVRG